MLFHEGPWGVCLRRLVFVLPSVVCSIFNVLIDIQKVRN